MNLYRSPDKREKSNGDTFSHCRTPVLHENIECSPPTLTHHFALMHRFLNKENMSVRSFLSFFERKLVHNFPKIPPWLFGSETYHLLLYIGFMLKIFFIEIVIILLL